MPATTTDIAERLHLGVFQFSSVTGAVEDNIARIAETAHATRCDLLLTPELSLTGYDVRDDVHTLARPLVSGARAETVWGSEARALGEQTVLVGAIDRADSAVPFNAAVLLARGAIAHVHRKVYLPTYGMFDEGRYFGRGRRVEPFVLNGWRMGVLVCEDLWHPLLAYLHAMQGAHALLVMAAAPGRDAWTGGEEGAFFASSDAWERIARTYAQLYGLYVIVCNRCGVEGGITFAGESLVVAPDASVVARAGIEEQVLQAELCAQALRSARTPYAHVRDEDLMLARQELARLVDAR